MSWNNVQLLVEVIPVKKLELQIWAKDMFIKMDYEIAISGTLLVWMICLFCFFCVCFLLFLKNIPRLKVKVHKI